MEENDYKNVIRSMMPASCRKTENGKYEAYISNHSKTEFLGTYDTEEAAKDASLAYRMERLSASITESGNDLEDGVVVHGRYVAFPSGDIFNLHGTKMQGGINRDGYRQVILNNKNAQWHRVIAEAFVENPNNLEQINHVNGVKSDNRVENLEWCTRSDNLKHAYGIGLEKRVSGEHHHSHKLTAAAVREIRATYKPHDRKYGATALGKKFGVDRTTVQDAANGRSWKGVEFNA